MGGVVIGLVVGGYGFVGAAIAAHNVVGHLVIK